MLSHDAAPLGDWPVPVGEIYHRAGKKCALDHILLAGTRFCIGKDPLQTVGRESAPYVLGVLLRSPTRQTAFSDVAISRWRRRAVAAIRRTLRLVRLAATRPTGFHLLLGAQVSPAVESWETPLHPLADWPHDGQHGNDVRRGEMLIPAVVAGVSLMNQRVADSTWLLRELRTRLERRKHLLPRLDSNQQPFG